MRLPGRDKSAFSLYESAVTRFAPVGMLAGKTEKERGVEMGRKSLTFDWGCRAGNTAYLKTREPIRWPITCHKAKWKSNWIFLSRPVDINQKEKEEKKRSCTSICVPVIIGRYRSFKDNDAFKPTEELIFFLSPPTDCATSTEKTSCLGCI